VLLAGKGHEVYQILRIARFILTIAKWREKRWVIAGTKRKLENRKWKWEQVAKIGESSLVERFLRRD